MVYTKPNDRRGLNPQQRILTKIRREQNGCWTWLGLCQKEGKRNGRTFFGYGVLKYKSRGYPAHRFSWIAFRGEIPQGKIVCHGCDNPKCVNPDHLFIGTSKLNIDDCVSKDRHTRGIRNSKAKLTDEIVKCIKADYRPWDRTCSMTVMSQRYGVSPSIISDVIHGKRWKHVL